MPDPNRKLVMWGWIAVMFCAPVSIVTGIILMTRNVIGHGIAQLSISLVYLFVIAPVLFGGSNIFVS